MGLKVCLEVGRGRGKERGMIRREREKKACRKEGKGEISAHFLKGNFSRDSNSRDYFGVAFKGDAESK